MDQQVFNFIAQTLVQMNYSPIQIKENANILLDLGLDTKKIDFLFSTLENKYHLKKHLMFCNDTSSLKGLANYVGYMALSA